MRQVNPDTSAPGPTGTSTYAGEVSSEPNSVPLSSSHTALAARISGCLLGGALGDALATGPDAVPLSISANTALALYSLDGVQEAIEWAASGVGADETACVWLAYLRWLRGRGVALPDTGLVPLPRPIDGEDLLRADTAMDADPEVIAALSSGEMGTRQRPVNTQSPSPAALVRSAPFGLLPYVPAETVYKLTLDAASLTHGHPAARHAAAVFAVTVHGLLSPGTTLRSAAEAALDRAASVPESDGGAPGLVARLRNIVAGAGAAGQEAVKEAGNDDDATAGDALAQGLAAALAAEDRLALQAAEAGPAAGAVSDELSRALRAAAAAGPAAAVVTGSLLGTLYGELPGGLLDRLRERAAVERLAGAFTAATITA